MMLSESVGISDLIPSKTLSKISVKIPNCFPHDIFCAAKKRGTKAVCEGQMQQARVLLQSFSTTLSFLFHDRNTTAQATMGKIASNLGKYVESTKVVQY